MSVLQKQTSAKVASCSGMSTKEMLVHLFSVPWLIERVLIKKGEFGAFVGLVLVIVFDVGAFVFGPLSDGCC